ncbi:MAG: BamA/TamA family outer membrane protein [Bacteroidales bacterium]|nr:BamA/TamA family outer membrane protein [Bacteroidales bacterium]
MKSNVYFTLILLVASVFLTNCKSAYKIGKGTWLLNKNSIKVHNQKNVDYDKLNAFIKQKPNKKILGFFRFHLLVYKIGSLGKENRFKHWLKYTIGESPVLLDSTLTKNTLKQYELYFNSKGYFNNNISKKITFKRKKANVAYDIILSKPYTINNIIYNSNDTALKRLVIADNKNCLLKKENNFDIDVFEEERDRLAIFLKNQGYFYFTKDFINFSVDSALKSKKADVYYNIKLNSIKVPELNDSIIPIPHNRYNIDNIFINTDYFPYSKELINKDTMRYDITLRRSNSPSTYYFIYDGKLRINPKTYIQNIFIKNNSIFKLNEVEESFKSLNSLQNFKFVNIDFKEKPDYNLDCFILLSPAQKQSFTIETTGTNSAGDLGIAANLGYQNINLFKGAEIFSIKLKGAMEVQKFLSSDNNENLIKPYLPFNTLETGLDLSLNIPKFLLPVSQIKFSKNNKPKTFFNIGFNFQKRSGLERYISNVSFGYMWNETTKKTHILYPFDINSVNITMDSAFTAKINSLKDQNLIYSYQNHLNAGLKYNYIFNSQQINKLKNFIYFRSNLETAGNLLYGLLSFKNEVINNSKQEFYSVFNNRFAQYIKLDFDFRYYNIINSDNSIVYRGILGFGIPYINSTVMPFEKRFFGGGANDLRAWEIRSLGPGSYSNPSESIYDKTGDIKLSANVEYRFPLIKMIKGALFIDAGNIWLKYKNSEMPGADFSFNRFYKEFAIGSGLGFRLDFGFFIIRLDAAIPVRNTAPIRNNYWIIKYSSWNDVIYNLGIGYPF